MKKRMFHNGAFSFLRICKPIHNSVFTMFTHFGTLLA
jgi:hypothetical protein